MPPLAHIAIHPSQFPARVRRDLRDSLRARRINPKFHYDSVKQTQQWLALHAAYSPSRTDADCAASYDRSFAAAVARISSPRVHLVGLGCGGGQKDARLLKLLLRARKQVLYTPSDVSTAMVLVARETALKVIPEAACFPLVCDLAVAPDLPATIHRLSPRSLSGASRLFTFFGLIPNFEPQIILPRLARLVRPADLLLFSANLAPGPAYASGVRKILPLYDNALTRAWLMTFLIDLGVARSDGSLRFTIEDHPAGTGLKRVAARFHFKRSRTIAVDDETFQFRAGEQITLFFSYRYTPAFVRQFLSAHRLQVLDQWITRSEEEGVFLCAKKPSGYRARP